MKRKITSFFSFSTILLALSSNVLAQTYCTPTSEFGCAHSITNVNLAGATITLNKTSACGGDNNGYIFYSSENKPDLIAGNQYTINVTVSNYNPTTKLSAWIDFNGNGVFDDGAETIIFVTSVTGTLHSNTFTVPANAQTGTTRMRISYAGGGNASYGPCDNSFDLDAEDYLVDIQSPSGCMDPVVDLGTTTTLCTGSSLTLDAGNPGLTYSWNTGATSQTITVTQAGTYTVTVTDGACSTEESITITEVTTPTASGIQFVNTGTCAFNFSITNGQNIDSYSWNFGDGSAAATTATPSHAYATSGAYTVTATLTNGCGNTAITQNVTCNYNGLDALENTALSVYPNPAKDQLVINSNETIDAISLVNVVGQTVAHYTALNSSNANIEVSNIENGIYSVIVSTANGVAVKRIEIAK